MAACFHRSIHLVVRIMYNVSDEDTADFMLATFDFMLSATDDQTGLPADGNQLVQRWFWYSLNEHRYNFGGSIFDPDNGNTADSGRTGFYRLPTLNLAQPDLFPVSLSIAPVSYNSDRTLVNYRLDIMIGNNQYQPMPAVHRLDL